MAQTMATVFNSHYDVFMNVKQVAEYLHLNEKKIYALVNEGQIPATKITGKWMFPRELIDRWMLDSTHGGLLTDRLILGGSDDPHASARYRRELVRRLGRAAIEEVRDAHA